MVRCAKDLLALKKNGAGAWGRLLFIHDNQESCINRLLKINSNNGRVSPVAWRLMELTTMINYHLPHSRKYRGIPFILHHLCVLHPYQTKVMLNSNLVDSAKPLLLCS